MKHTDKQSRQCPTCPASVTLIGRLEADIHEMLGMVRGFYGGYDREISESYVYDMAQAA